MIKRLINGYEQYDCSNCGTETYFGADYCQICGHEFVSIRNEPTLTDSTKENETMCIVVGATYAGQFVFTQLKMDDTPKSLLDNNLFSGQRLMREANPNEFYVFQASRNPNLSAGQQVNIVRDDYEYFVTSNYMQIYYNKKHFSELDIAELKTYNFN